jgi:alpha-ketoglutarate-dependent 2,4-dichlorophenoxyacetate dioxygenase
LATIISFNDISFVQRKMINIQAMSDDFVAEVVGLDLSQPIAEDVAQAVMRALDQYGVLVLPDQPLTEEQQMAFAGHFGPLERAVSASGVYRSGKARRLHNPELSDISNLDETGEVLQEFDIRRLINISNQLWHTDSSFRKPAASVSMLSAQSIPPVGGLTEFADMRAAWDALPGALQARLDTLSCEHDYFHSRSLSGHDFGNVPQEWRDAAPPVVHPMVRTHPGSGRKSIYLASHIRQIVGLSEAESQSLLDELMAHSTQAQFVHRHRWRTNDLVIWDNRCTMHRGRPFPQHYKRAMRRATVQEVV